MSFTYKFLGVFASAILIAGAAHAKELELSKNGSPCMPIVIPDAPTKVEEYSARELKEHLDKISGGDFKILKASEASDFPGAIYVGDSPKARQIIGGEDPSKFKFDQIRIKTADGCLALIGHPKRGTLFAVESFLEDVLGVRWWTADESFIPDNPTISIKEQDISYAPVLMHRRLDYIPGWTQARFTARLRAGDLVFDDKTLQRQTNNGFAIGYHSFYPILPPEKYFKDHPEWYSLDKKGKRLSENGQLCLTNEEMTKEFTKNVLEKIRARPDSVFAHISQNDWYGYCECKKCSDFVAAHGGEQSAAILHFINKIAEEVEKEFPDIKIVTFAYQYGRHAPKGIKPRSNVWIELCSIECDFAHPLETDKDYGFTQDIIDWSKLTNNLTIWNYVTNYSNLLYPFPNLNCIAPDIRFFIKHGAVGLFEQSDAYCNVGDFVRMRHWIMAHLMWNPSLDEKKLRREFLHNYYTPEIGPMIEEYLRLLNDRAFSVKYSQACWYGDVLTWLDIDTFIKASKLMEGALDKAVEMEAKNPEKYRGLAAKIRRDRTSFDWYVLMNYANIMMLAERDGKKITHLRDPEYTAEKILKVFRDHNTIHMIPRSGQKDFKSSWFRIPKVAKNQKEYLKNAKRDFESKDLLNDYPKGSFFDFQDDHFLHSNSKDRRIRIPCEYVADKNATNGYAAKLFDGDIFQIPLRDYLLNLKSASGKKERNRVYRFYGYISTKGAKNSFKTSTNPNWREISTDDKYKIVDLGTFTYTPESMGRKYVRCHTFTLTPKDTKNFFLDRIVVVEE